MSNITTRSYDMHRSGCYYNEKILTPAVLRQRGVRLLATLTMPGDQRGSEGSSLIVENLSMPDGAVRNVLFHANMANYVCAWDADTFQPLWQRHVDLEITGTRAIDMYVINDHWGILSTPVIDVADRVIYVVSMGSPDNKISDAHYYLHSISLYDGHETKPKLSLNNASYQAPGSDKISRMGNVARKQRCGLSYTNINGVKTVFVANGSFLESADTNQGWVIACDVGSAIMTVAAAWTTTSKYSGAGIWQGGQGPSVDDQGNLLGMTGNGAFDGINDFGETFYKLKYTPKSVFAPTPSLTLVDYFTPFTDTGRVGGVKYQTTPSLSLIKGGAGADNVGGAVDTSNMDNPSDEDLNSGGPLFIPKSLSGYSKNVIMGAGKDGILYIIDSDNMGKPKLADFAPERIKDHVYAHLLQPPYGFTAYFGNTDLAPTDLSTIPTTYGGFTHHQHSTPVFYKSPSLGPMLFTWGENGNLRAFQFNADFSLTYKGCSAEVASPNTPSPGGMPGGMIICTANGTTPNTGIIWACVPYGNANNSISPGHLIAYAADSFTTFADGSPAMIKLWDSGDWGIGGNHNKFNIPVGWNGKVYRPTYDGTIQVFG